MTSPDEPVPGADDWRLLSLPLESAPPSRIETEEDLRAAPGTPGPLMPPPAGPPGSRIFSLEGRPAPALYLVAWLLTVGGIGVLFITSQAAPSAVRTAMGLLAIIAVGLGLAFAAGYQVVARADRPMAAYRGPSPLIVFGIVLVLSTLVSSVLSAMGLLDTDRPFGFLAGLVVVALGYVVAVWLFVVRTGAMDWVAMGWPARTAERVSRSTSAVVTGIAVMIPATFGALILGGIAAMLLGVKAPAVLPTPGTTVEALAVAIAAAVVAPIGEEVFFRGFALSAWARDLPVRSALLRSAGFFAFVHIANISATSFAEGAGQAVLQLVVIFPLGLVLGWLFLRAGILSAIAGHMTYNGLLLLLLLLGPGSGGS